MRKTVGRELLPAARLGGGSRTTSRSWTDLNGNFFPDCDLLNFAAQSPATTGSVDTCGPMTNQNFGKNVYSLSYDPLILQGWGVRPSDWQLGVTVQHEIAPRLSLEVGYARRWLQNFTVTDNTLTSATDYTTYSITAPSDPRLPGGGGYVVSGLYDVVPTKVSSVDNVRTYAPNYGNEYQIYNGVDVNLSARMSNGLTLRVGSTTGSRVTDYCEIRAKLPEQTGGFSTGSEVPGFSPVNPYCHYAPGFTTRLTGAGSYTIPKVDVLIAGTLLSSPGTPLAANYVVTSAVAAQTLGRPLSGSVPNVTVNLLKPGEMWGERVNQLDFRIGKTLRFGSQRANIALDLYNALNKDTILNYNQAFTPGGNWLVPTTVMTARTAKITVQYDF